MIDPSWLRGAHALGAVLLGIGLTHGAWAWHQVRGLERRGVSATPVLRRLYRVYLFSAVPGSLLLLGSGLWLIHGVYGWAWALERPWVIAMMGVTVLEFSEGITVTRGHLEEAMERHEAGSVSAVKPAFAPHLDLPLYLAVLGLGVWRPEGWGAVVVGMTLSFALALVTWRAAALQSRTTTGRQK